MNKSIDGATPPSEEVEDSEEVVCESRGYTERILTTSQLPDEIWMNLAKKEFEEYREDIENALSQINDYICRLHRIPSFLNEAVLISEKIQGLIGRTTYEIISNALHELNDILNEVIAKISARDASDYFLSAKNNDDGTFINDTKRYLDQYKPYRAVYIVLRASDANINIAMSKYETRIQEGQTFAINQASTSFNYQETADGRIRDSLRNSKLDLDTARQIIEATGTHINHFFEAIAGQYSLYFPKKFEIEWLGDTEAERINFLALILLDTLKSKQSLTLLINFYERIEEKNA